MLMEAEALSSIRSLAEPILTDQGVELVELTCRPQQGGLLVRLLVDKSGGVLIQDCARMNQVISQALEVASVIEGSYTVEVSSPGLDRPLVSQRDFERALGEDIRLTMHTEEGNTRDAQGRLLAVPHEAIVLQTASGNVTIPLAHIRVAKKVIKV